MKFLSLWFKTNQDLLRSILKIAKDKKVKLYLVGGVLRDIILKRQKDNLDLDFCLKKGAINFAREVARKLGAGFVVLDESHGCGRVVKKMKDKIYTLDFSDFRGKTLEDDLLHRDFSINSMAVELEDFCKSRDLDKVLIDPHGGRNDLRSRIILSINKTGFDEDPLRILRAFSLAALFDLGIAKETLRQVDSKKDKLKRVSAERIRDEIFKILSGQKSFELLTQLDKHGILDLIIPEIKDIRNLDRRSKYKLRVWKHSLETVKSLQRIIKSLSRRAEIKNYLLQDISSGRRRSELIKLAALLHDLGKPKTFRIQKNKIKFYGHERVGADMVSNIGFRLKLSNEELRVLRKIVMLHLRPGYLVSNPVLTPRAKFRFFRDANVEAVSVLLIALADERATRGYLSLEKFRQRYERLIPRLIRGYFLAEQEVKPSRLINGNDLMEHFKLPPSPLIGKILSELQELQAIGKIKTKAEGFKKVSRMIKNTSKMT
jgi:poly(A) polymerase